VGEIVVNAVAMKSESSFGCETMTAWRHNRDHREGWDAGSVDAKLGNNALTGGRALKS
jgi:hypothetical protein